MRRLNFPMPTFKEPVDAARIQRWAEELRKWGKSIETYIGIGDGDGNGDGEKNYGTYWPFASFTMADGDTLDISDSIPGCVCISLIDTNITSNTEIRLPNANSGMWIELFITADVTAYGVGITWKIYDAPSGGNVLHTFAAHTSKTTYWMRCAVHDREGTLYWKLYTLTSWNP